MVSGRYTSIRENLQVSSLVYRSSMNRSRALHLKQDRRLSMQIPVEICRLKEGPIFNYQNLVVLAGWSVRSFVTARVPVDAGTSWISRDPPCGTRLICIRLILISARHPRRLVFVDEATGTRLNGEHLRHPRDGSLRLRIQVTRRRIRD